MACPHSTIRAFLLTEEELANCPEIVRNNVIPAVGGPAVKELKFRIQVTPDNCVGCGLCSVECPVNPKTGAKALTMANVKSQEDQIEAADYVYNNISYKTQYYPTNTVKGASFLKPYFEVSGACAGCGETPYAFMIFQFC